MMMQVPADKNKRLARPCPATNAGERAGAACRFYVWCVWCGFVSLCKQHVTSRLKGRYSVKREACRDWSIAFPRNNPRLKNSKQQQRHCWAQTNFTISMTRFSGLLSRHCYAFLMAAVCHKWTIPDQRRGGWGGRCGSVIPAFANLFLALRYQVPLVTRFIGDCIGMTTLGCSYFFVSTPQFHI